MGMDNDPVMMAGSWRYLSGIEQYMPLVTVKDNNFEGALREFRRAVETS
jgi:hypothetical protein